MILIKKVFIYFFLIVVCIGGLTAHASAQSIVKMNDDGELLGTKVRSSGANHYFLCSTTANKSIVVGSFRILTAMSNAFKVRAPSSEECLVSQGKKGSFNELLPSLDFYTSESHRTCLWTGAGCGSAATTRSAMLKPNPAGGLLLTFQIIEEGKLVHQCDIPLNGATDKQLAACVTP